jgi:TetR/AcrR family transcriptional regulator, regulator of mycofactocin system
MSTTGAEANPAHTAGLRERKKAMTRATIEATALQRFLADGYERVRLEDLCADCVVSTRTFFRYFSSKEDLVLDRLQNHLGVAADLLAARPADEPLLTSLREVIIATVTDYSAEPERELARLRLVATTPALQSALARVFAGFDQLIRRFAGARENIENPSGAKLVAAAAVSAFRIGLEDWVENDARIDLAGTILGNLDQLTGGITGLGTGTVRL